jgi:hypothetical protein
MSLESLRLPNLFFADLGPELELTPNTVREACHSIRRNREHWLRHQSSRQLIDLLAYVGEQWLSPDNPIRQVALKEGSAEMQLNPSVLACGLDGIFEQLTSETLETLIIQDLGDARRLDEFVGGRHEMRSGRMALVHGPELLVHWAAGNVPNAILAQMTLGILTKSAQFIKCASNANWVPRLFAHSLALAEPKLGSCLELAVWPRNSCALEEALLDEADCVVATGSDEMIQAIRSKIDSNTRFLGYGHKLSFGFITREVLSSYGTARIVRDAATDVVAWDQLGCLSPHVYYVENGGAMEPEGFAAALAEELSKRETVDPRGPLSSKEAVEISSRRRVYEMRAAASDGMETVRVDTLFRDDPRKVRVWKSDDTTAWTVVFDSEPGFKTSCLNRFIYVKPVEHLKSLLAQIEPVRHQISTVGLAAVDERFTELALALAQWGVPRVCPIGRMQSPSLAWRHDGQPALAGLVRWTDLET